MIDYTFLSSHIKSLPLLSQSTNLLEAGHLTGSFGLMKSLLPAGSGMMIGVLKIMKNLVVILIFKRTRKNRDVKRKTDLMAE